MIEYFCEFCNYITNNHSHIKRHKKTKKHLKNKESYEESNPNLHTNSLFSHTNPTQLHTNPTQIKKITKNVKKPYFCENCNKKFGRKDSLKRHQERYCKNDKKITVIEIQENNSDTEKLKEEIKKELLNEIGNFVSNEKINNMNNFANCNNTYTININNYGEENLDMLHGKIQYEILQMPFTAIPQMISNIHFNKNYPENNNIRILNKRDNKIQIRENNKWKYVSKENAIRNLIEDKNTQMEEIYKKNMDKLNLRYKERFHKFKQKFDLEDETLWNDIMKDTELVFWNNT